MVRFEIKRTTRVDLALARQLLSTPVLSVDFFLSTRTESLSSFHNLLKKVNPKIKIDVGTYDTIISTICRNTSYTSQISGSGLQVQNLVQHESAGEDAFFKDYAASHKKTFLLSFTPAPCGLKVVVKDGTILAQSAVAPEW